MSCPGAVLSSILVGAASLLLAQTANGGEFRINGVSVRVDHATVNGSVQQFAAALTQRWRVAQVAEPIARRDLMDRVILGRRIGSRFQSVEIRTLPSQHRVALTSTVTPLAARPRVAPRVPFLPATGLRLISAVESRGRAPSIVFTGLSTQAMATLDAAAQRAASAEGWSLLNPAQSASLAGMQRVWLRGAQSRVLQVFPGANGSRFVLVQQSAATSGD